MLIKENIILAGIPRSGSTLACHLLNKANDTVALHEPIEPHLVPDSNDQKTIDYIKSFFEQQRNSILESAVATSKSVKGRVPDNHIGSFDKQNGKRSFLLDGNQISINKPLSRNFKLVIKQPGLFSALLQILLPSFPCYATIRNPLAVLQSWNSVDMAVANGHAPAAEQRDENLKAMLENETDIIARQLKLLSWFFEQYYTLLPDDHIIRYEDVVNSGGKSLKHISQTAATLNEKLRTKNDNPMYDSSLKHIMQEHLLDSDGFYWKFYSRDECSKV